MNKSKLKKINKCASVSSYRVSHRRTFAQCDQDTGLL